MIRFGADGTVDRSHWNARAFYRDTAIPNALADALDVAVAALRQYLEWSKPQTLGWLNARDALRRIGALPEESHGNGPETAPERFTR